MSVQSLILLAAALNVAWLMQTTAQCVPAHWKTKQAASDLLYTLSEPIGASYIEANIGNGYLATVLTTDAIYVSGVYNGRNFTQPSHRARIPNMANITVTNAKPCAAAMDFLEATYIRRSCYLNNCSIIIEQTTYAHRARPHALIHTIQALGSPELTGQEVVVDLLREDGGPSVDIAFGSLGSDPCLLQRGSINTPEVPGGEIVSVAVCTTNVAESEVLVVNGAAVPVITSIFTTLDTPSESLQDAAINAFLNISDTPLNSLHSEHAAAWAQLWQSGVSMESDNATYAVWTNASLYYILSAMRHDWHYSVSPGGTANNAYAGHVFWDCETWMYPNILVWHPDIARGLIQYRINRMPEAETRARDYGFAGLMFPWESAFTGVDCCPTGNPEGRYEQHINGDIALSVRQFYFATRNLTWLKTDGYPLVRGVAEFWASRAVKAQLPGGRNTFMIYDVQPPDESAGIVNNSVYTNAVAAVSLQMAVEFANLLNQSYPPAWPLIAENMYIPYDSSLKRHPEYDGYLGQMINQADVALLQYPLGMSMPLDVAINDLEYYENKTRPNGYFTGDSSYSISWMQLGHEQEYQQKAYSFFDQAFLHIRGPFAVFQEKVVGGHSNFITGAGGYLQNYLYGFGGLRYTEAGLTIWPVLPAFSITRLTFRGVHFAYVPFTVSFNETTVTLSRDSPGADLFVSQEGSSSRCNTFTSGSALHFTRGPVILVNTQCS